MFRTGLFAIYDICSIFISKINSSQEKSTIELFFKFLIYKMKKKIYMYT
jgi:hypothetical protein